MSEKLKILKCGIQLSHQLFLQRVRVSSPPNPLARFNLPPPTGTLVIGLVSRKHVTGRVQDTVQRYSCMKPNKWANAKLALPPYLGPPTIDYRSPAPGATGNSYECSEMPGCEPQLGNTTNLSISPFLACRCLRVIYSAQRWGFGIPSGTPHALLMHDRLQFLKISRCVPKWPSHL